MALINEIPCSPKSASCRSATVSPWAPGSGRLACKRFFDFTTIIPCHYGTFPILDQTADKFLVEMGGDVSKVTVPEAGVAIEI